MDILEKILAHKAVEVDSRKAELPLAELTQRLTAGEAAGGAVRGFGAALQAQLHAQRPGIIAEIKKASPSQGVLRADFDVKQLARDYADCGATCLSVLTDQTFFQGQAEHLAIARGHSGLPVLRKDFMLDPYQIYEARVLGADAVLLLVGALDDDTLGALAELAQSLQMDVLLEVHDRAELHRALQIGTASQAVPPLIGINNRNLRTFETDLNTTIELLTAIPSGRIVVTESGVHRPEQVQWLRAHNVHAFLVGEALMRAAKPGEKLRELFCYDRAYQRSV